MTKPTIRFGTPSRSIASIARGMADSLLVVANAIAAGSRTARTNCRIGAPEITMISPKITMTKMINPK